MSELFDHAVFLKYLAALLAVFNPLYGIPVFLNMTEGFSEEERRRTAITAGISVTVFAIVCVLAGEELLSIFGIDVPSFRIGGGLILVLIGLNMLNAEEPPKGDKDAVATAQDQSSKNIAVVPLAIPLTYGPGALAVTIVFAHQLPEGAEIVTLTPAVLISCALVCLGLLFAQKVSSFLGPTVISVATRVMAIILVAVAVEMMVTGAFAAFEVRYPNAAPSG